MYKYYYDYDVTADCGCEIEVDADKVGDGCCDMCWSETIQINAARIVKACAEHGGSEDSSIEDSA